MHFGRVAKDSQLDLSMPVDRERTEGYLRLAHQGRGLVYPGAPIWADRNWVGTLYPPGTRNSAFLRSYAQHYATVEYNGSFYALPDAAQIQLWVRQVGSEFRFCPKLPREVSHTLAGGLNRSALLAFQQRLEAFGSHCGLSFMQLPDDFGPQQGPALARLLEAWSHDWPLAIEFRHPAWFHDHMLIDPLINLLYRHRVSAVITDTPGRRDALHLSLSYPQVIVRFLGTFPSARDHLRLAAWAERLRTWTEKGLDTVYFFVHQERHVGIPPSIDYLTRKLWEQKVTGLMQPAQDERPGEWDSESLSL